MIGNILLSVYQSSLGFFNNNWLELNPLFALPPPPTYSTLSCNWHAKQGIKIAIFFISQSYARQLNQHPHVHVFVTYGYLDIKHVV
ncbi:MAG: transposase [Arsenophonus sp. NEOnobi-MAG3]